MRESCVYFWNLRLLPDGTAKLKYQNPKLLQFPSLQLQNLPRSYDEYDDEIGRALCSLNVSFYPTLFAQSGQRSTPDDKILFII